MEEQKQEMKLPKQENAAEGVAGAEGATEKMQMVSGMTGYEQDKKARRMLVWLIVLAVVAVAGLATTGLALALRGQDVAELEEQVAELKGDVPPEAPAGAPEDAPEKPEGEVPAEGEPVAPPSAVDSADYVYVGEWGLKIKIPDNFTVTGYVYAMDSGGTAVGIWGNTTPAQYFPDFVNQDKRTSAMGYLSRVTKGEEVRFARLAFSDDNYDYYYSHPQDVYSTDADEQEWEVKSVGAVEEMLTTESNFSKI